MQRRRFCHETEIFVNEDIAAGPSGGASRQMFVNVEECIKRFSRYPQPASNCNIITPGARAPRRVAAGRKGWTWQSRAPPCSCPRRWTRTGGWTCIARRYRGAW